MATQVMATRSTVACDKADQCPRRNCFFIHPSGDLCPSFPQPCNNYKLCRNRHPPPSLCDTADAVAAAAPPRRPCRFGDGCTTIGCKWFHTGGFLCKFDKTCNPADGRVCTFRHPSKAESSPVVPIKIHEPAKDKADSSRRPQEASPAKRTASPPKPKHANLQDATHQALVIHDRIIQKEQENLRVATGAASRCAVAGVDSQDELTRRAMQAKLQELIDQRAVFVEVTQRLGNPGSTLSEVARGHILKRELFRFRSRLPALAKRIEIERHLASSLSRFTVIQGQTGSGKSTQIPQYAADLACFAGKRILCTQPRKLAATTLATRVAFEYSAGWDKAPVGGDVGYRVGGRAKTTHRTRIEYITEAVLLDMIARARRGGEDDASPFEDVGCIVVDEAHERSITCDLIMGSLKENHDKWRHVKVAITSATIDIDLFSGFFENAPVVEIPGRMFPVEVQYVPTTNDKAKGVDASNVATVVSRCALMIQQAFPDPKEGDLLCFLPGQDDVLRAKDLFESSIARLLKTAPVSDKAFLQCIEAHALYGKQDADEQALVFKKKIDTRRVIFATDVAETSVTIDGVVFVVDSGLRKAMVYDAVRNMSSLKVHTVSRSSAVQRCGRAGRTRPGKCFRLYSQQDFEEMEIGNAAELFQQPLTLAVLTLCHVGIRPREFHWIEAPNADAMARAEAELTYLSALDPHGGVTPLGRLVAEAQVDPKWVRLIDRAAQMGLTQVGVDLVALLSVANMAFYRGNKNDKASKVEADKKREQLLVPEQGDVVSLYRTYREWIAQLEGDTTVDEPPSKPKPETEATDEDAEDDDAAEQEESGWAAMMASNLKQFVRKAAAAVVNRRNDQDDGERSTVDDLDDGNDDDDTKSVISVGSDCSGTSFGSDGSEKTASKKWKHKRNEKRARAWCLKNSVNSKAMGIAQATAKELLSTLTRAKAWSHGAVRTDTATNAAVTDEQLRRLLTAGFFLNAAVNKPVSPSLPRRGGPQYYALYSDVLGSLFMGSALHLMEKKRDPLPSWILFDSILRLNATTLLSLATPIEETWIKDESPAFYEVCTANRAKLPVLTFEYEQLSFAVLRNLFGKSFHQVNRWESQLKCTLSIDNEVGTLTVFCAPVHEAHIRSTFESKFATLQKRLANEANEEVYLGTTRAVIGHGFQAQALLFDKDFVAITVRNLPNISDHEFEQRLVQWTRQAGCSVDAIRCADLLRNSTSSKSTMSATIKFVTKEAAHQVYECMRGDSSGGAAGSALSVTPLRIMGDQSSAAAIRADFAGRIKLTWADGEATGGAHVFFRSPLDANEFVRNATTVLASPTRIQVFALGQLAADQAVVAAAATDVSLAAPAPIGRGRGGAKSPPKWAKSQGPPAVPQSPTTKELTGDGTAYQVVFDTAKITQLSLEQQARLRFGVHIKCGLPPSMDEHQLLETIRRTTANVAHARILRKPATASVINTNESELERRFARMMPLVTCLDDTSVYTDFVDEKARRAGVVVFCRDMRSLNETYQMARGSPLWEELERPHGQPIRMELENSYTTSIHSDIHRCFREQIALILTYARAKGAMYQESQPSALAATAPASKNMVTLKFLGDMAALQRVKAKLDDVLSCEKVSTPDIMLLFSVTGRYKAQEWIAKHMDADNLTSRYFVRWINTKHEFWVYGDAPSRQDAVQKLLELARQIKELDVLDKVVRLNKYKNPKAPPIKQWLAKCPAAQELFAYWTQSTTRLLVSGSQAQVQAVLEALDKEGLLFKERKTKVKDGAKPICAVCGFTVDDPFMLATICNHAYCIDCVQPMAQPMTCSLPLVCPALGCGQTLHVDDVAKLVNGADALSGLVEMAVFDFVAKHQDRAFVCLKPGCNQILSAASITGESDAAVGGRSIYCDQCNADYCVGCSAVAAGRAVPRHAKLTCEAFRARQVSPQIAVHLKFIQEQILNASCPNCHAVFLDFTGCTSVQCGNATCGQFFCANCLVFSSKSSSDTHNHVARCESNPSVAHGGLKNYFVDTAELDAVHRLLRCQKLATYFTETLKDDAVRYMVYKRLAKDLQDLGVDIPETLKGSKEASRDACFVFGDDDDEDVEQETPADRTIRDHIHHVREHLFNLKCPKCQLVFVDFDFDSCAALTCANPICAGGFCAYCLADCGADAHKHVSGCAKNPNRPYYYITEEEFRRVHKERREALVGSYLRDVVKANDGLELAQRVREALAEDFRSIGLEIGPIQ